MRLATVTILIAAIVVGSITTTAISLLVNLSHDDMVPPHLTHDNLVTGKAHHLFLASQMWQRYPAPPTPFMAYVDLRSGLIMLFIAGGAMCLGRCIYRWSYSLVGLICLLSGAIPYTVGTATLADNTAPETAGPWLACMLLSVLYGSLICIGCLVTEIVRTHVPTLTRRPAARHRAIAGTRFR